MLYHVGDWVFPADLPRPVLCRVTQTERLDGRAGGGQILRLAPFAGPWPAGTKLVRLDDWVRPVDPRELWQTAGTPGRSRARRRPQPRLALEQSAA